MKKIFLVSLVISFISIAFAHEFWLHPNIYFTKIGELIAIRFNVGENFTGENWKGNNDKIQQLLHYTASNKIVDIRNKISNAKGDSLQMAFEEEGTQMIIFNSTNSFINLEAKKFNEYLMEDGLTDAFNFRKQNNQDTIAGKEYYQRNVKTIVQCGSKLTKNCTKPTSLTLDIVPETNPYETVIDYGTHKMFQENRFRVYFKKTPLPNVMVKHWYTNPNGSISFDNLSTNKRGWVTILQRKGVNMISCVYMEQYIKDSSASWQSYWGSVTFNKPIGNFFIKQKK